MRLILSAFAALFLLIGCQQEVDHEYNEVSIKDEESNVLVTSADFEKASIQEDSDRLRVKVDFKDSKLPEEMTEQYLNEQVYIYLGDKEIASPIIRKVTNNDSIQIIGDYTKEEAEQFVSVINQ
ncbi:hypothetical protein GLW00_12210 [Halobacillus litoralis]|uniref:SecDF P1 head subdomain domain-containing protein n=1 Tax=Halobacillus litoralis TaxID=45668 RepID=A0A845FB31_9BACI|nr:hypothetical protein [Halobacillus litoralis]MYL71622.1 hypothetical protein [Halobacillus litoralis]